MTKHCRGCGTPKDKDGYRYCDDCTVARIQAALVEAQRSCDLGGDV
jgi:uncharacterized Zn finger protein (UPF0148 family)